jgi:1A family penicillin-binding protein
LRGFAVLAIVGVAVAVGVLVWALRDIPWKEIADGSLEPVAVLEAANGEELVSQGPLQAAYAEREDFPQHLVDAVISAEDRRFYQHAGLDLRGIARALFANLRAGEIVEGGSTITQQLVKILYLESDRTFKRKIQEAAIALWLERTLGKDEILARYLNNIYLGAGATGMPAAARVYFDKEVGELDVGEAAMLAGIIRAPSQLNPLENIDAARERADTVLATMVADGRLSEARAAEAKAQFAELNPARPATRSGSWFADWVIDEAREIAGPYRGTIRVRTSLRPRLQAIAERVVAETLQEHGSAAGASQAALVAMTPDGGVVAMVGGRDYEDSEFNRAVMARRQPGSAFKLFTFYAALKEGYSLNDVIEDAPIRIGDWEPENYNGEFRGSVTVAEAFARSLNAATVALAMEVGIDKVIEAARELGIDTALDDTPSVVLGSYEVSLLDLTGAYASVRAGMAPIEPWGIASFQADGQPRGFSVRAPKPPETDLQPYQADLVQLLQLVVERGTGQTANIDGFAAGKTGTSQNFRDAWFVGFTEPLVAGVWVGNDDDAPMNEVTGGELPAEIWRNFMVAALAELGQRPGEISPPTMEQSPPVLGEPVLGEEEPAIASLEGDPSAPGNAIQEVESDSVIVVEEPSTDGGPEEPLAAAAPEQASAEAPAACNQELCSRMFRSFRASDCTYQPYDGPRRLCSIAPNAAAEEGRAVTTLANEGAEVTVATEIVPAQGESREAAAQSEIPLACNYRACSRAYRSFRPSDCTYQPFSGPRQLCEM